jgi:hypothetical protein
MARSGRPQQSRLFAVGRRQRMGAAVQALPGRCGVRSCVVFVTSARLASELTMNIS